MISFCILFEKENPLFLHFHALCILINKRTLHSPFYYFCNISRALIIETWEILLLHTACRQKYSVILKRLHTLYIYVHPLCVHTLTFMNKWMTMTEDGIDIKAATSEKVVSYHVVMIIIILIALQKSMYF